MVIRVIRVTGIAHLRFMDYGWQWVNEAAES
jgi:hypothetical protein